MRAVTLVCACASATFWLLGQTQSPPQAPPQYFDEPSFIVAGVADPSQRGGHGSDPVLRSADVLAKATASLRTDPQKQGNALEAIREYQRDAELDPSEANLFDWGAELLTHRGVDQAIEVFLRGNRLFPHSTRMLLGLAVALYSRGSYDEAATRFFEATDVKANDPAPYMFLGKIASGPITESSGFAERMERFANLHPENAWANYFYAVSVWRHRNPQDDASAAGKVQFLLEKAVRLDPNLSAAFLELGAVFADRGDLPRAIAAFENAIKISPSLEEAHYRLAQAYQKAGQTIEAQKERAIYQQLSRESEQAWEHERSQIQQFVFELRGH
jgi:tetratricopeptide (TPR) repeat protein